MIIGVPKEIKDNEGRVALTPHYAGLLIRAGHEVLVEEGAGRWSGYTNNGYTNAGATICNAENVWVQAQMIVKVKEPWLSEWSLLREGIIVFAFFHFPVNLKLKALCDARGVRAIPYESIRLADGSRPILAAMSRIAGEIAADVGAHYLRQENGGIGILLKDATATIIGAAGTVGMRAYEILKPRICRVFAFDIVNNDRLGNDYRVSTPDDIAIALKNSHLVIGAAVNRDTGAPKLVTRNMVSNMPQKSVIVDVAIDEGGISETSRPTTHSDPVYEDEDVIHYCVPNMPGAVPRSSTRALVDETFPYILKIANGEKIL